MYDINTLNNMKIIDLVTQNAHLYPQKTAIYFGKRKISYQQLENKISNFSRKILSRFPFSKQKKITVGLYTNRSPEMIILMLAILKIEGVIVPLSPCFPEKRVHCLAKEAEIDFMVTNDDLKEKASNIFDKEVISISDFQNWNDSAQKLSGNSLQIPDGVTHILYTSGSTGIPKGVMINEASILNVFDFIKSTIKLKEIDIFLALTDFSFDVSITELIFPLTIGASIVLTAQGTLANSERIKSYLNQFPITVIHATPATWYMLTESGWTPNPKQTLLSSGEAMSTELSKKLTTSGYELWNLYAPTETTIWSTAYKAVGNETKDFLPIGKPIPNIETIILDDEMKNVVPGEIGQLYISGIGLASGYLNDPLKTQEKFIFDKMNRRLYATGDLVCQDKHGCICYCGRLDEQLKIGGIRIEPGEIESVFEKHKIVKKAVVQLKSENTYVKQLVTFLEVDQNELEKIGDLNVVEGWLDNWKSIYDNVYNDNSMMDFSGWVNAFTGRPYSQAEMECWFENTVYFIEKYRMLNFLDVGCGKTFIMKYIPGCVKNYMGIDISDESIAYSISNAKNQNYSATTFSFHKIPAHELTVKNQFDFVLINSVVQYFPNKKYLNNTLEKVFDACKDNSTVVISDIRNKEFMDLYFIEKCIKRNMMSEINYYFYKKNESELHISPRYFCRLKKLFKKISHIDYSIKYSEDQNDLGFYRYDIMIHFGKKIKYVTPRYITVNELLSIETINNILSENLKKPVVATKIQYSRFIDMLNNIYETLPTSLKIKLGKIPKRNCHDLDLRALRELISPSHKLHIKYNVNQPHFYLDLFFYPDTNEALIRENPDNMDNMIDDTSFIYEPYNPALFEEITTHISTEMKKILPEHMCSKLYIYVKDWPKTISGKIDKIMLSTLNTDTYCLESATHDMKTQIMRKYYEIFGYHVKSKQAIFYDTSSLLSHYFLFWLNKTFSANLNYMEFIHAQSIEELLHMIQCHNIFDTSQVSCL